MGITDKVSGRRSRWLLVYWPDVQLGPITRRSFPGELSQVPLDSSRSSTSRPVFRAKGSWREGCPLSRIRVMGERSMLGSGTPGTFSGEIGVGKGPQHHNAVRRPLVGPFQFVYARVGSMAPFIILMWSLNMTLPRSLAGYA